MTVTLPSSVLATYTKSVLGLAATPVGLCPTGIVATTPLVAPSITDTVLSIPLET
jgi:hypothetical protein